jgi:hypothetical protein
MGFKGPERQFPDRRSGPFLRKMKPVKKSLKSRTSHNKKIFLRNTGLSKAVA